MTNLLLVVDKMANDDDIASSIRMALSITAANHLLIEFEQSDMFYVMDLNCVPVQHVILSTVILRDVCSQKYHANNISKKNTAFLCPKG